MLPCDSQAIERREVSGVPPRLHIKFRSDAPNKLRASTFGRHHPREKKQIARLYCFRLGAERLRRRRELDAKLLQALFGVGLPCGSGAYHLSTCAA